MVYALLLFRNWRIDVRSLWGFLSERAIRGLSSIFGTAKKYGSGWIGQVILIGGKCSATLTVKLNYAPNKNSSFFLLQVSTAKFVSWSFLILLSHSFLTFFFYICLFDGARFQYFQVIVIFFFIKFSDVFVVLFLPYFSFILNHYQHFTVFKPIWYSVYIFLYFV